MPFALHSLLKKAQDYFAMDDACRITYSQFGEDVVIWNLLTTQIRKKDKGFYVDVGAFHPRLFSNSKFLSMLGWNGINIDANETSMALFREERPNDINLCCGAAKTKGELTYYKFTDPGAITSQSALNTCCPERAKELQEVYGCKLVATSTVPVLPINTILEEHLPDNQKIDYMNIDVENLDDDIIKSLDLSKYKPTIFSIEMNEVNRLHAIDNPVVQYIVNSGYFLASINFETYIFVDNKFK